MAFKKGCIPYNKGIPCSEETKKKMSIAHKGHIVTEETKKKISKSHKGKPSGAKGKHFSEESKKKISKANRGHLVSGKTKKKISLTLRGHLVSEETRRKLSKSGKEHLISKETRRKMGNALRGKMPKNLSYPPDKSKPFGNIKRGTYNINGKEIFFRSKWEAHYALYLNFLIKQKQIRKWEYEKDVFIFEKIKFGMRSYRPDFKIYNNDGAIEYHEVKGHMTAQSKTKLRRFKKYYPKEFAKLRFVIKDKYSRSKTNGEMIKFLCDDLGIYFIKIISYKEIEDKLGGLIPHWERKSQMVMIN